MAAALPHPIPLVLGIAVPLLVLIGLARFASRREPALVGWWRSALVHRSAPAVAGLITGVANLYVWGSVNEPGIVHDERAYLLQAEIFAAGRATGVPPPAPEFFEQAHVLLEPSLAAKYPPVHSLVLAPGVALGMPAVVPILLATLAGGFVFALARAVTGPMIAALTHLLWSTSAATLAMTASYFSETTSLVLWLLALWGILQWQRTSRRRDLVLVSLAFALMFLTRPLTAVALGAPAAVAVLLIAARRRIWSQVLTGMAAALPILAASLLWNHAVLGTWTTSPYTEYRRQYLPFDKPGFGIDSTPPLRSVPEIEWLADEFIRFHESHQPAALPGILVARSAMILLAIGKGWRAFLIPLLFIGIGTKIVPVRFALISAASLVLAHLVYAHPAGWTIYYAEAYPVFFLAASIGLVEFGRAAARLDSSKAGALAIVATMAILPGAVYDVFWTRNARDQASTFHRTADRVLASVAQHRSVVFVNHPLGHLHQLTIVHNTPDYRTARTWVAWDRGDRNQELLELTDRAAYRLYTADWRLERIR